MLGRSRFGGRPVGLVAAPRDEKRPTDAGKGKQRAEPADPVPQQRIDRGALLHDRYPVNQRFPGPDAAGRDNAPDRVHEGGDAGVGGAHQGAAMLDGAENFFRASAAKRVLHKCFYFVIIDHRRIGKRKGLRYPTWRYSMSFCSPHAMVMQSGSVNTQAATILPAIPQRTAERRLVAPTPMIAEEIT